MELGQQKARVIHRELGDWVQANDHLVRVIYAQGKQDTGVTSLLKVTC